MCFTVRDYAGSILMISLQNMHISVPILIHNTIFKLAFNSIGKAYPMCNTQKQLTIYAKYVIISSVFYT